MKLFYMPNTCAMGTHLILEEIGATYTLEKIDFAAQAQYGDTYKAVNPKSKVPVLGLEDGSVLTEWPAIAFYLASRHPGAGLWPAEPLAQARVLETIDYVVATIHMQGFARIFRPGNFCFDEAHHDLARARGREIVLNGLDLIAARMAGPYVGEAYSIADAALFYAEVWAVGRAGLALPAACAEHLRVMRDRPAVRRVLEQEAIVIA